MQVIINGSWADKSIEYRSIWTILKLPFAMTSCQVTINGVDTSIGWYTDNTDGELLVVTYKYENGSKMLYSFPETPLKPESDTRPTECVSYGLFHSSAGMLNI